MAVAVLASMTLVPAMLGIARARVRSKKEPAEVDDTALDTSGWARLADVVTSRPWLFAIVSTMVLLVMAAPTVTLSLGHSDGGVMLVLADWAQRIVTFRPEAAGLVGLAWPYKVHMVLGMTIFLLFPFSRLVHVWSGLASVAYLFRPYQIVRSRRLNVPRSPAEPRPRAGA